MTPRKCCRTHLRFSWSSGYATRTNRSRRRWHGWRARLRAQGTTPPEAVAREHRAQRAANATVRNIITSMRWMSSIDWLEFFESVSLVDADLRGSAAYPAMDFETRDEYRRQVEILSRGSGQSEIEIARRAGMGAAD